MSWQQLGLNPIDYGFDPDDGDDPVQPWERYRCGCGAFLSTKTTHTGQRLVGCDYEYDDEGDIIGTKNERYELVEYFSCKKCGGSVAVDEL
jgi:hypothetical protein